MVQNVLGLRLKKVASKSVWDKVFWITKVLEEYTNQIQSSCVLNLLMLPTQLILWSSYLRLLVARALLQVSSGFYTVYSLSIVSSSPSEGPFNHEIHGSASNSGSSLLLE